MSCEHWLIVVGAVLEVGGIGVVAWEIHKDVQAAKKLRRQVVRVHPAISRSEALPLRVSGGGTPSLEDRVAALEARTQEQEQRIKRIEAETSREIADVRTEAVTDVDQLRAWIEQFLDEILSGGWRLRAVGVTALIFGVAFTAAGSVIC